MTFVMTVVVVVEVEEEEPPADSKVEEEEEDNDLQEKSYRKLEKTSWDTVMSPRSDDIIWSLFPHNSEFWLRK